MGEFVFLTLASSDGLRCANLPWCLAFFAFEYCVVVLPRSLMAQGTTSLFFRLRLPRGWVALARHDCAAGTPFIPAYRLAVKCTAAPIF